MDLDRYDDLGLRCVGGNPCSMMVRECMFVSLMSVHHLVVEILVILGWKNGGKGDSCNRNRVTVIEIH